jgi:hypothetical protein
MSKTAYLLQAGQGKEFQALGTRVYKGRTLQAYRLVPIGTHQAHPTLTGKACVGKTTIVPPALVECESCGGMNYIGRTPDEHEHEHAPYLH